MKLKWDGNLKIIACLVFAFFFYWMVILSLSPFAQLTGICIGGVNPDKPYPCNYTRIVYTVDTLEWHYPEPIFGPRLDLVSWLPEPPPELPIYLLLLASISMIISTRIGD